MTHNIGTATRNITVNDHVDVWLILRQLAGTLGVSMGQLLRQVIEIGLMAICLEAGEKVRRIHSDYYGGEFWQQEGLSV